MANSMGLSKLETKRLLIFFGEESLLSAGGRDYTWSL